MAGSRHDTDVTTVFIKNWQVAMQGPAHRLQAESDDFQLRLLLEAQKEPVPHGLAGYSRKGSLAESASCYYSITRLEASGTLTVKGTPYEVEGLAWMDHEYSSAPLEPSLAGWDWFSVQLADQSELMIYLLRQRDGSLHPASSGTFVDRAGQACIWKLMRLP
jgi:predicted secreted hydrolase